MLRRVQFGDSVIEYELSRKRVKNINLRIRPDRTVHVSAPRYVTTGYIDKFVLSRGDFILKHMQKLPDKKAVEYVSGEVLTLFSESYKIAVIYGEKPKAELFGGVMILTVTENTYEQRAALTERLIKELCLEKMTELSKKVYPFFKERGVEFPTIRVRKMTSRWGSCIPSKKAITFNTELAFVPIRAAEYVAAHELTHFLHPDHSKGFYDTLYMAMPDYKERKKLLENS